MKNIISTNISENPIDKRNNCSNGNGLVVMAKRFKNFIINTTGKDDIETKHNVEKNIQPPDCGERACEETFSTIYECPICRIEEDENLFYCMIQCKHRICMNCFVTYLFGILIDKTNNNFECTICNESIHPNDVINIINEIKNGKIIIEDSIDICEFLNKYENLFLQSTLEKIPGISWCPGTDCNYAVITKCAKSKNTKVTCENKECGIIFCSYCSSPWHKGISCKKNIRIMNKDMIYSNVEGVKNCPNCLIPIYRINDGSCNHIYCPICKIEFCWLCLKNVTEFHYITYSTTIIFFRASGCTFYGSNAWTSKKKLLVGLCLILFAPLMVTIPGILFAAFLLYYFPYKMIIQIRKKYLKKGKSRLKKIEMLFLQIGVSLASPFVAVGVFAIGITISFSYIYIVLPATMIAEVIKVIKSKIKQKN